MNYTIKAVNPQTRAYSTKFGEMVSYKVLFEGIDTPVEISQKASSKAPEVGDNVDGTIDMSAPYGPKFKKEFGGGQGFGGGGSSTPQANRSNSGGRNSDPYTMYLSYAKDAAVASVDKNGKFNEDLYAEMLDAISTGGKTLYGSRPGAETETSSDEPKEKPVEDVIPTAEDVDSFLPDDIAAIFDKADEKDKWPDDKK